ncbi:MAG: sensor histidine kinase [Verrucomicrobiota bacterium]
MIAVCVMLGATVSFALEPTPVTDSYSVRTWQAEDGLPENRVLGIVQSSDGFLWVATQGGVVRFDGVRFQRVRVDGSPGLIGGTMRVLLSDSAGRIWLAKEGGVVVCFDGQQVRTITPDQGLPKNETQRSMAVDGEGGLWIAYTIGKVIRLRSNGKVDTFSASDGLPTAHGVYSLITSRDGTLWFAKGGEVGIFRNGRFVVLENFGSSALRIAPSRSSGIWVSVGQRVLKFDRGMETVELGRIIPADSRDRSSAEPSVLLEDRSGAVWVGTASAGLFRCDSNSVARVEVSNPSILSLAEDREGNLWVGTRGGGLNRVHRRVTSLISSSTGLPVEAVQSVCQDATGARWVVGENGVLACSQGDKWVVQLPAPDPNRAYVTCVAAGTNGCVWVGTRGGTLYRWTDGKFQELGLRDKLQKRSLRCLLVTTGGDLWIGTDASSVLYRFRDEKLQAFPLPSGYRFVRTMTEDAYGNVWAGASDGLLVRISGDTLVDATDRAAVLSIRCLYGATNGDVWIGYAGSGVGRLRNGEIKRFGTEQGLPNDFVSQILEDGRGSLWFGGNQGIFQVRQPDFDKVADGAAARVWPVVYGRSEGLPGLQASFDFSPPCLRSSDGRLFFSMLSGLAEVRLDYARINRLPPGVFIERVIADGRTFALYQSGGRPAKGDTNAVPMELGIPGDKSELRLPPGLQQVQFEFTALSFVAPENVQFRYQLEGLDEKWVDAGTRRVAEYTHPPPGTYHFRVIACNNDGVWNSIGDAIPITFEPYIWETIGFKVAATLVSVGALCGLLVLVLRRRHRREMERLEHQRALESERTRIARDLHDDLGVGLTEIGLLGDLAGTNSELPETSRERFQEITGRARNLAASLDEIVWAINPNNDTSQSLVDYFFPYAQKLLGRATIRCRLEVIEPLPSGNLSSEDRHEFFHAYKEALNNIIRHSGATEVQVSLSAADRNLMIRVADNGRGLDGSAGNGSRHGLSGMRERLLHLGGRCEITSLAGSGTTVTFIIPVQSEI